jgi:DNA polymerase-1
VNYLVQGSAADLLKRSMIRVFDYLKKLALDAHLILTIHDELGFEILKKHAHRWLLRSLAMLMADNEGHFDVPTPVELQKVTNNWSEKLEVHVA